MKSPRGTAGESISGAFGSARVTAAGGGGRGGGSAEVGAETVGADEQTPISMTLQASTEPSPPRNTPALFIIPPANP